MTELDILRVKQNGFMEPSVTADWNKKNLVWVPQEKEGFVLASIVKEYEGFFDVELLDSNERVRISHDDIQKVNPPRFEKCEDMASMSCLNEASVLHNLRQRYFANLIYTYSGLFCVVINPYRRLPIYTDQIAEQFKGKKRSDVPPHIFAVADEAYRSMLQDKEDQSILCTGESGAGKTENTKKVIQYLTYVACSRRKVDLDLSQSRLMGHLEDQLLLANPILEAFGNSKTVKNDNSSRFGKFIRIHFDGAGCISGANIEFYLLEKSRVLKQAKMERSFHIFYQMLKGAGAALRDDILLESSPNDYTFLGKQDLTISGVDDKKEFEETMHAMDVMGFSSDEIRAIFRLISAILLLGNLEFASETKNSDQAVITNDSVAQKICTLLGLNLSDFMRAFLKPKIKIQRDTVHRAQNEEQVRFATAAIAKACYERLFRWLVHRLNRSLDRTRQHAVSFVGILDIAGFEIFEMNSFEQLCINYTNEKLQQLFNNTMFIKEQQEYLAEGLDWDMIDFGLNLQPTIDLIEKPSGILSTLDDVCLFPQSSDASFVDRLHTNHHNHPKYLVPEMKAKSDFVIVHYAGRVDYQAEGWRVKNMDPLNENVVDILQSSKENLVSDIWRDVADLCRMGTTEVGDAALFGARVKKGMFRTVSQVYKEQLSCLMSTLGNTNPHFVRCIIPNHDKRADVLNAQLVLEQLRCNGVLEGIRICRQGFPNRLPFQEFRQRYERLLAPDVIPHGFLDGKEAVKRIVDYLEIQPSLYRIGQSKIFFRTGVLARLESMRDERLVDIVIAIQARIRGVIARRQLQRLREQEAAIRILQRNGLGWIRLRGWQWWRLLTKVKPLLEVTNKDEMIAEKENALKVATEKIRRSEVHITDMSAKLNMIEEERAQLQQRLDIESLERAEADEARAHFAARKEELEKKIEYMEFQLRTEEDTRKAVDLERKRLTENLKILETQLVDEESARQKIQFEKNAIEQRLKLAENQILDLEDGCGKALKEKQLLESRCKQLADRLQEEEEKAKSLGKQKAKIEALLEEMQDEMNRERQNRTQTDAAKRTFENELRDERELGVERMRKLEDTLQQLQRKDAEYIQLSIKFDENVAARQALEREVRELQGQLEDLREELKQEKSMRAKAEAARRNLAEELEAYKQELEESQDKSALNQELRSRKEKEYDSLKRELEETIKQTESRVETQRLAHSKQLEEINDRLDSVTRQKTALEKARAQQDAARVSLEDELAASTAARQEAERKRKTADAALTEQQLLTNTLQEEVQTLSAKLAKCVAEMENTQRQKDSESESNAVLNRKVSQLEAQIGEMTEMGEEDKVRRNNILAKLRAAESDLQEAEGREQELMEINERQKNEIVTLRSQITELRKKLDEEALEKVEEMKRRLQRELQEALTANTEAEAAREKADQAKKKAQQEAEDATRELRELTNLLRDNERKQRKFDQLLADERSKLLECQDQAEAAEQRAREWETKSLLLAKESTDVKERLEQLERERKILQVEVDNLVSNQDDVGRNSFELMQAKRRLEEDYDTAREQIIELEDALTLLEEAKNRVEVNFQAARQEWERTTQMRESDEDEKRRALIKQVRDLDDELNNERRLKTQAVAAKRKAELQAQNLQESFEQLQKQCEDSSKQLRRLQQSLKDAQTEATEARTSAEEAVHEARETERKLRACSVEKQSLADELSTMTQLKKKLEEERNELQDSLVRSRGSGIGSDEKRRWELLKGELEDALEDEQSRHETTAERLKHNQMQLEKLTAELAQEKSACEELEMSKASLEKTVRDLQAKVESIQSETLSRHKVQLAASELAYRQAKEQAEDLERDKMSLSRAVRRLERNLNEARESYEEERRRADMERETAESVSSRWRQAKRDLSDREDEMLKDKSKLKEAKRQLEELTDQLDALTRENQSLKNRAQIERRSILRESRRFGSSNSLRTDMFRDDGRLAVEERPGSRPSSRLTSGSTPGPSEEDADEVHA